MKKVNSVYSATAKQFIHDVLGVPYTAMDLRSRTFSREQFDYLYMLALRVDRNR